MTRYKLPEVLGGGEHESVGTHGAMVGFELDGVTGRLWLTTTDLTEVKPPLPPEPPVGTFAYAVVDDLNCGETVLHRRSETGIDWLDLRRQRWFTWADICSWPIVPVLLVPAPEPVELPWTGGASLGHAVSLGRLGAREPLLQITRKDGSSAASCHLGADDLRALARAAWTAADQAEAQS